MASVVVTQHNKLADDLLGSLSAHGPAIIAAVLAKTAKRPRGAGIDVTELLAHAEHDVRAKLDALLAADGAHEAELADDAPCRDARDAAATALAAGLVTLKGSTRQLFGAGWVRQLSFPAEIPADPVALGRVGDEVIAALGTKVLPKPTVPGVGRVDAQAWIDTLQGPRDALSTALGDVTREQKEARATMTARDTALVTLVGSMVTASQLALSLARLGDVAHLVDGLRGTVASSATAPDAQPDPTPAPETIAPK